MYVIIFTFAILGFNGIHTLEGRWKSSSGQEPIDYQLHCYTYESQSPKSEIRCELFGSSSRRFFLIHYDESTDSYIVNGENAGKPNPQIPWISLKNLDNALLKTKICFE